MKRLLLATCLAAVAIAGCSETTEKEISKNSIQHLELTGRESSLIQAIAGSSNNPIFLHEFKVEEKWKSLSIWLEKYEYGQLKDKDLARIYVGIKEKGDLVVSFRKTPGESSDTIVKIAVLDDKGSSSTETSIKLPKYDSFAWGEVVTDKVELAQDMILAQMIFPDNDESISIGHTDLYNDPVALVEATTDYPAVYFVRCSFSEKDKGE
ncbi:hypothetical protein JFL43_19200 [Viridibacillus sp. YIM B01967]|uniref:Lipoprotein n=1 Tax=Viridibacillus soli TaxID=2798301 RepID=A0ABS1HC34_9BACL|nr:hypothetical protein [Viridibacillus soli]MBK3496946.1 hypothetical protein [Viridibacillus soli]